MSNLKKLLAADGAKFDCRRLIIAEEHGVEATKFTFGTGDKPYPPSVVCLAVCWVICSDVLLEF